jgi:hypothetical protein
METQNLTKIINQHVGHIPAVRRQSDCYRPVYCNGKKIDRIILHDGEKVLFTRQSGWLEHHEDMNKFYYSDRDVVGIDIEVRKANKINLSKKDNFIIPYSDSDKSYFEKGNALYIYVTDFTFLKTLKDKSDDGLSVQCVDIYSVSIPCEVLMPYLDENKKLAWKAERMNVINVRMNNRSTRTKKGESIKALLDDINTVFNHADYHLSTDQLQRMLSKFDIVKK